MGLKSFNTAYGDFMVVELPNNDSEITDVELEIEGKKVIPIGFINQLTKEQCIQIVEKYGPFNEYKGGVHPSGGAMKFRAYNSPLSALKCLLEDKGIDYENGYIFKVRPL